MVFIPKERKTEFIQDVLSVLYRGGIRRTEEIVLVGKPLTVVRRAQPDENGIVSFNYSIFEKQKRSIGTFNTKFCTLDVSDRGYMEYGVVVNLLMVLQQTCSARTFRAVISREETNQYESCIFYKSLRYNRGDSRIFS